MNTLNLTAVYHIVDDTVIVTISLCYALLEK